MVEGTDPRFVEPPGFTLEKRQGPGRRKSVRPVAAEIVGPGGEPQDIVILEVPEEFRRCGRKVDDDPFPGELSEAPRRLVRWFVGGDRHGDSGTVFLEPFRQIPVEQPQLFAPIRCVVPGFAPGAFAPLESVGLPQRFRPH